MNTLFRFRIRQLNVVYYVPKHPKNDSHDFQKYKTLDTIIIIIIDAITELRSCLLYDGWMTKYMKVSNGITP